ncbi:hypothetical protein BGW38_005556, partial [Lunasporangiospora selenospora]
MSRSVVLLVAILVALIQACTGLYLPEGIYQLKIKNLLLTGIGENYGQVASLSRPDPANPEGQQWHVSIGDDNKAVFRNLKTHLYLSYEEAHPFRFLTLSMEGRPWTLEPTEGGVFIETLEEYE